MRKPALMLLLLFFSVGSAAAMEYPRIQALSRDDLLFVQLQDDVERYYRMSREKDPRETPSLSIFSYRRRGTTDDLFSLNARCGITYDALATLNGIENPKAIASLDVILIASQPGLFIHDPPRTELEQMMLGSRLGQGMKPQKLVIWRNGAGEAFSFFPGSQFNEVERAFFLHILFRFPIDSGPITSRYGSRLNPFSGHPEFHMGIDIGAPEGTEVHAARGGIVAERRESPVLGNYVVVNHPGGYQTVYGHLSAIRVTLGAEVETGSIIGKVGRTGLATGPHLHFEVRRNGESTDPLTMLALNRGKN
jgi:murein DD-endopeptidase MepM/ murein hydrolase activator NlpD